MFNTICHIEFEVRDLERSKDFYAGLFGWQFSEFPIPGMKLFGYEDKHLGGLMLCDNPRPGNTPSLWFRVKDLDAMVEKAVILGGSLRTPKGVVPNVGWSACVSDLDGNPIGLVQYSEDA